MVRAVWRDDKYQAPLPKAPKIKAPPLPETSTGEIWARRDADSAYEMLAAKAGDLVTIHRNGYYGVYEAEILSFRGRKVKVQVLRRDGSALLETPKPVWIRRGFSQLKPQASPDQVREALENPQAFIEKYGKPTTLFSELYEARRTRLADAPLIDPDEVQKGRDWSELGSKVFGKEME